MFPIETERLLLRPVTEEDVTPAYLDALNDPEVVRWTEARHTVWDRERVLQWIRQSNVEGVSILVGIFLKGSGRHIGNLRLFNFHPIHQRAELSFIIFDKTQWSKGYATEGVRALTDDAFRMLGLHRIHADYYAVNTGSARVFQKAGFAVEGVSRQHVFRDGGFLDSVRVGRVNHAGGPTQAWSSGGTGSLIPSAGPSITEREVQLVTEAAREGWYRNMSRYLDAFEERFAEHTGMRYCLATNSCTAAIHLAMLSLGVGPGDEVIVPDLTWVASAAPICYVGARPVFVDVDPATWCLAPEAFERAVTKRTKAVIVVGLLGNLPDMRAIRAIARRRGIPIVEDAAQSAGAEYRGQKAGTFGTIGVFSFNGTKLLVTGEGGMFVTNSARLHRLAKGLAHHGLLMRGQHSRLYWSYALGYKYKMTNLQAAQGLAQLARIEELVSMRRRIFSWYQEGLRGVDGLQLNQEGPHVRSTFWLATAILHARYGLTKEALRQPFIERGIAWRPFFYPLSAMPPFQSYCRGRRMAQANPVTYRLSRYGVCLPSAASLTEDDVDYVCRQFIEILAGRSRRPRPARGIARRSASERRPATVGAGS